MKDLNLNFSQKGLAYFPDYALYATFYIKDRAYSKANHKLWQELAQALDTYSKKTDYRTIVLLGVGFELWEAWSKELGYPLPSGMGSKNKLNEYGKILGNSGGDLWFHIKSDSKERTEKVLELIRKQIGKILSKDELIVPAEKRHKGTVLGGRFIDGLENPADAEDLSVRVIVGEDPHRGAAFLLSQKFIHDWTKLNAMSELQKQNMIGRDMKSRIVPMDDESSHIKRVRQLDGERINFRLVRQALPYGHATDNKANEQGVFFAGYAQSTHALDSILDGIAGDKAGFVQDQLFSVTRSDHGSYWYIPSLKECGIDASRGNDEIT